MGRIAAAWLRAARANADAEWFALHLAGGGTDLCCADCLEKATTDRALDGLVSIAETEPSPAECCGWCGRQPEAGR